MKLTLTDNIRVQFSEDSSSDEFAKKLLQLGNDEIKTLDIEIDVPYYIGCVIG